jgi:hypothetical protein
MRGGWRPCPVLEQGAPLPVAKIESRLCAAKAKASRAEAEHKQLQRRHPKLSKEELARKPEQKFKDDHAVHERIMRESFERDARLRAVAAEVAPLCRPQAVVLLAAVCEDSVTFANLLDRALASGSRTTPRCPTTRP